MDVKVLLSHRCFLLYTIYLTIILQNFVFTCAKQCSDYLIHARLCYYCSFITSYQ